MPSKTDFSFDKRVTNEYNKARLHPAEVSVKIGQAIADVVGDSGRVLEIGVGTGRIGYPVASAGCHVVGFDLSADMLGETDFHKPTALSGSLNVMQADMHHIPSPSNGYDGVLAVHVLHLATDWQRVMREAIRVLRIDGAFIIGNDWIDPASVTGRLRNEVRRYAVTLDPTLMPPAAGVSREQVLADLGATSHEQVIAAEWSEWLSPNDRFKVMEQRLDAESWIFTDEQFDQVMTHLHQCADNWWDDLDEQQEVKRRFILNITRGNWSDS
ncbi:MAG: class I SAM-dependent methyltransferase [Chloroflexota bacterium]